MADQIACARCAGCGQITNSDDGEPWSVWLALPLQSSAALLLGLVQPLPCPVCAGSGRVPMSDEDLCLRCGEGEPSIPGTYCEPCFDVLAAEYAAEMQAEYEAAGMPWPPRDCDLAVF